MIHPKHPETQAIMTNRDEQNMFTKELRHGEAGSPAVRKRSGYGSTRFRLYQLTKPKTRGWQSSPQYSPITNRKKPRETTKINREATLW